MTDSDHSAWAQEQNEAQRWAEEMLLARFMKYVEPITESGCWIWTGTTHKQGYGHITVNNRPIGAHRVSYELFVGNIPQGMCVCHRCDVTCCVNPSHLFLGTYRDNNADRSAKGRWKGGVTTETALRGEHHGMSKLTEDSVRQIRSDNREAKELAPIYGVTATAIRHIKSRKNWRHVQ